jgi:hypothetical protein
MISRFLFEGCADLASGGGRRRGFPVANSGEDIVMGISVKKEVR